MSYQNFKLHRSGNHSTFKQLWHKGLNVKSHKFIPTTC